MFKQIAAAALVCASSSTFAAAPVSFYGGVDLGVTDIRDTDYLDSHKGSLGAFIGYGINPNFAVEVGYRHLGKWDLGGGIDLKAKQTHVSVLGFLPINPQADVFLRVGYNKIKAEASFDDFTYGDDVDRAVFGLGLNYSINQQLSARMEVQKPASDVTNLHAALVWAF